MLADIPIADKMNLDLLHLTHFLSLGGVSYLHSLSGFTRRLVLQLLLETERVVVHINSPQGGLSSPTGCSLPLLTQHPKFGAGHKTRLLNLPTTTTMSDIVKMVTGL